MLKISLDRLIKKNLSTKLQIKYKGTFLKMRLKKNEDNLMD
jgi:hypothetical protein